MAYAGLRRDAVGAVRAICDVPLVASGGAGSPEHFVDVFDKADVDAALAASMFHSGAIAIPDLKTTLAAVGSRCGCEFDLAKVDFGKGGGLVARHRAGRGHRRRADDGVHESRSAGADPGAPTRCLLRRSKQRLWEKGETTGHTLDVVDIALTATRTHCS